MAQSKTIQLLRSSRAYANIEAAKTAIQGLAGERKDGEILLGRYWSGTGNNAVIKSVLAVYHAAPDLTGDNITAGTTKGWTFIQDITSSSEGLQALQTEVDAIETALGFNSDGTKGNFTDSDALQIIAANDTIAAAVEKVAKALGALDKAADAVNGQVVTTVTQVNGAVTETKANVKDLQLGGYSKEANVELPIGGTDTVNTAFSKLENSIAKNTVSSLDRTITINTAGNTTDLAVNIDGTTLVKNSSTGVISSGLTIAKIESGLGTNVKEAYQLQDSTGTQIGQQINIYKDSALKEVYLGASTDTIDASTGVITKNTVTDPQSMNFAYQLADGTYSLTKIDVSKFLTESEFGDGLQVSGGVVSVKVGNGLEISDVGAVKVKRDSTCESFLTVGPDGVKLSGVQNAIDAVKVTTDNTGATYVNLAVDNATGRALTLTNTMQAMSTADSTHQGLAEASDVKDYVDTAVANKNVTATGDNYVSASASNNAVTIATDVQNLTFTQGSGSTDSTLSGTANSLADGSDIATKVSSFTNARISEEIAKLDGSATATAASGDVYTVLTSVTETDGVIAKGGEVTLAAVAKTGAAADVSVAADATSGLAAGNVQDTLETLTTAVGDGLNSVSSGNGAIGVAAKSNKNQAISLVLDTATGATTDMLAIGSNGLSISNTWDCGTF